MDKKTSYPRTSDVDQDVPPSYNEFIPTENPHYHGAAGSSSQPSAPPQEHIKLTTTAQPQQQGQYIYYQTIQMPSPHSPPPAERGFRYIIRKRDANERHFPVNASIFLLGCIFPPVWFIGCCWKSKNKYEIGWRKLNICLSILSIILFLFFTLLLAIAMMMDDDDREDNKDSSWEIPSFSLFFA